MRAQHWLNMGVYAGDRKEHIKYVAPLDEVPDEDTLAANCPGPGESAPAASTEGSGVT